MTPSVEMSSSGKASQHLAHLAEALRPVKDPWYVRHPVAASLARSFPSDGWYWIPEGQVVAEYLAHDAGIAEHELRTRLDRLDI